MPLKAPTKKPVKAVKKTVKKEEPQVKMPDLATRLKSLVIGQEKSLVTIADYYDVWASGFTNPERPPAFLLMGPTGVGKTHTVEAFAECIHGCRRNVLKINCGEYQMEHEIAKLIGAPPGYLGHRETKAALTNQALNEVRSAGNNLGIVLFDEIEKAASTLSRILLGILDKGELKLGDNSTVYFANTMIFFTSNLGAREMLKTLQRRDMGFERPDAKKEDIRNIAYRELKRRYAPEFVNRLTEVLIYDALTPAEAREIAQLELDAIQRRISLKQPRIQRLVATQEVLDSLATAGSNPDFGARDLIRQLERKVLRQVVELIDAGATCRDDFSGTLEIRGRDFELWALSLSEAMARTRVPLKVAA